MRNKVAVLLGLCLVLAFSVSLMADHHKHAGWITDAKCAAAGKYDGAHKACAVKCNDGGSKLVLYSPSDKKTFALDNQALAKEHIGHEVVVEGSADDKDSITVKTIEMVKK